MLYFIPDKLNNNLDKKKRKKCVATPEGDTVQISLKGAGLLFPAFSTPSFSPLPQEHLPKCNCLVDRKMEQNCLCSFQLSNYKNPKTKHNRVIWARQRDTRMAQLNYSV